MVLDTWMSDKATVYKVSRVNESSWVLSQGSTSVKSKVKEADLIVYPYKFVSSGY